MLDVLRIRGLALLDDVSFELGPGLNVLTGETGAGKSIIVDALSLLRGVRGRADLVREGEDTARVEAQFDPGAAGFPAALLEHLQQQGIELERDEGLVLERSVRRAGRGRVRVHDHMATVGTLGQLGEHLVEICSQHEHHGLADVARHLDLVDAYAGLGELRGRYEAARRTWKEAERSLEDLRASQGEALRRADYLRFQIDELDELGAERGEHERLRERLVVLREVRQLGELARSLVENLYEADDAVAGRLAGLLDATRRVSAPLPRLGEIAEQLEAAQIASEEASRLASGLESELEVEPGELERTEERLHELDRVCRKHGCEADELLDRLEQMRAELGALDGGQERIDALARTELANRAECRSLANELSDARAQTVDDLCAALLAEFDALHLAGARMRIGLRRTPEDEEGHPRLEAAGIDRAELLFSANPGEPPQPLDRVASGGELSRVMLAFKGVLGSGSGVSTYVFDEVDAGVGGAVADAIGRRLARAGRERQVLCITHLPQIAAFADAHFHVEKHEQGGRTVTRVRKLDEAERVEELARMLGGLKVGQSAREHAIELLAGARADAPAAKKGKGRAKKRRSTRRT